MATRTPSSTSLVIRSLKRRKQLEQDIEHITQEMYRRNRELATTNQTLSLLQTITNLALNSADSLADVCHKMADAIAESAGIPLVALLTADQDGLGDLALHGVNTAVAPFVKQLSTAHKQIRVELDPAWWPPDTKTRLLALNELDTADMAHLLAVPEKALRQVVKHAGVQSLYLLELRTRDQLVGFLVCGLYGYPDQVAPSDITLLDRLAEPVGVALQNRLLFDENQKVAAQLRRSNAKLKTLDETKDEFISMASHQLRTPLTAVKGYLSMVLEGDAGKLTPQQEQLLKQSYLSSQRMVFLISDLLNLSRLNTGKFVIERAPTDLSQVAADEVAQLSETAKARGVSLRYTRPAHFPLLMLDETKIHQVVMNFIDNAIYYTPSGGSITVSLTDTPTAVEYRVKDTGIGVPRKVQHHLFTKFYRADNARQARPDGTGLGLFMAKKVIIAQGGSLLFESQEGKGSTFGFRFSKDKHLLPPAQ